MPYTVEADTALTSEDKILVDIRLTGSTVKTYDGNTSVTDTDDLVLVPVGVEGITVTASSFYYEDCNAGKRKTVTASGFTFSGEDAEKYAPSSDSVWANIGEIEQRAIKITANSETIWLGEDIPELKYTISGDLVDDEEPPMVTLSCDADGTKAGIFSITIDYDWDNYNYMITKVSGTLTIRDSWIVTVDGKENHVDRYGLFKLPDAPSKPGCIFKGWTDGTHIWQPGDVVQITADTVITSVWEDAPSITPPKPDQTGQPEQPGQTAELPFTDVDEDAWYYDAVKTVCEAGLMNGVSDTEFDPNGGLNRAMFWTLLARAGGVDTDGGASWYANAQAWAVENGISDGADAMGALTREQLVTMLWRLNGGPVVNYLITTPDASLISSWALEAMRWAASIGLIEGDETGSLDPAEACTRAQAATFIVRYLTIS